MKSSLKTFVTGLFSAFAVLAVGSALAVDVNLSASLAYVDIMHEGQKVRVQRIQDQGNTLTGGFAKTSRKCPPFCPQPENVAPGVETVGELEVFDFMRKQMRNGTGIIVDARTPSWHAKGTIPGSINIPFTHFEAGPEDLELIDALETLGAVERENVNPVVRFFEKMLATVGLFGAHMKTDEWDFSDAKQVVLWCNGPWCGQSPRAIRALLENGYPAEKIHYYRGGMQMWQILGLTTIRPGDENNGAAEVASAS